MTQREHDSGTVSGAAVECSIVDGRPTIRGDCDLESIRDIEAWLATFGSQPLEVDLGGVRFFDSSALRAFLNVRRRNPNMRVVNPSKIVVRVLEITGTVEYLGVKR